MKYPKIHTVFKRDPATKFRTLLVGEFALPEFAYLANNMWEFTEKVDGTNIRVYWDGQQVRIAGRTDNAQLPTFLYDKLRETFPPEKFASFADSLTLYGEGYGAKIQSGGKYIQEGCDFVLFDVMVGEWWLRRNDVKEVADKLNIMQTPLVGYGTLHDLVQTVRDGLTSFWGDFEAEGIVARPCTELRARNGERIITKLKGKDFSR